MHSLELKAWVMRVLSEYAIRLASIFANLNRQLLKAIPKRSIRARIHSFSGSRSVVRPASRSAKASSAICARRSCDWSNMSVHRLSDASSADNHRAIRSCSSAGSEASVFTTESNERVIKGNLAQKGLHNKRLQLPAFPAGKSCSAAAAARTAAAGCCVMIGRGGL